jgi:hypothetical protein
MITIQVKKLDDNINPQDGHIIYVYHDETKIEAELCETWDDAISIIDTLKEKHKPEQIIFFDGFNL